MLVANGEEASMTAMSQDVILTKISKYLLTKGSKQNCRDILELSMQFHESGGYCSGFVGLWSMHQFLNKAKDFWKQLSLISDWDEKRKLSSVEITVFEETISRLRVFQRDQHKANKNFKFQQDRVQQVAQLGINLNILHEQSFSYILSKSELYTAIEKLIIPGKVIEIGSARHVVGMLVDSDDKAKIRLYDPNDGEEKSFDSVEFLVDKLWFILNIGVDSQYAAVSLNIFGHGKNINPNLNDKLVRTFLKADHSFFERRIKGGYGQLHVAAKEYQNLGCVKSLIRAGIKVDGTTGFGETALFGAAYSGSRELAQYLITAGCDVNAQNSIGDTCLNRAVGRGDLAMVKLLTENEADPMLVNHSGHNAIDLAIVSNKAKIVSFLASQGAKPAVSSGLPTLLLDELYYKKDPNINLIKRMLDTDKNIVKMCDSVGRSLLSLVVSSTSMSNKTKLKLATLLFKYGPNVKEVNYKNETLLHLAVLFADKLMVYFLLEHGVELDAVDRDGRTPLHVCLEEKKHHMLKPLLQKGANVDIEDSVEKTPLTIAIDKDDIEAIKLLQKYGCDLNKKSGPSSSTPLIYAVEQGRLKAAKELLSLGADLTESNMFLESPLFVAINNSDKAMIRILLEKGAKLSDEDMLGRNAFFAAIYYKNGPMVNFLVNEEPSLLYKQNKLNQTPYTFSKMLGFDIGQHLKVSSSSSTTKKPQSFFQSMDHITSTPTDKQSHSEALSQKNNKF